MELKESAKIDPAAGDKDWLVRCLEPLPDAEPAVDCLGTDGLLLDLVVSGFGRLSRPKHGAIRAGARDHDCLVKRP